MATTNPTDSVVAFRNVSFAYGREPVLADVTLDIQRSDFTWIVGPNGGGKTTLVKLLLGLLEPTTGEVLVGGERPARSRHRIGYIAQQIHLDPSFPIDALTVAMTGRVGVSSKWGGFGSDDRQAALDALERVGLGGLTGRRFSDLSGGQQRRLFIARALVGDPAILVLDEPTANLDPAAQNKVYDLLLELSNELTVITVSHDPTFVARDVERVVCVKKFVHVHPTREVTDDMLGELYGDVGLRMVRHDHVDHHLHGGGEEACD